ncbi:UNVERIFIED_CONTAM: hypothetical protein FKN15_030391 [Acipenser sinensis]
MENYKAVYSKATRPIVPEDNTNLSDFYSRPAGALSATGVAGVQQTKDYPADLNPLHPGGALPIVRRPLGTASHDRDGITWTRTSDLQAIGCILHSTWNTGCTARELQTFFILTQDSVAQAVADPILAIINQFHFCSSFHVEGSLQ